MARQTCKANLKQSSRLKALLLASTFGLLPSFGSAQTIVSNSSSGGGSGITIGTTTITSGTSGRVLYDNAGVVGELTTTGSGSVVLATSPTLVTPTLGVAAGTSLALGGATIGSNALAVTGTANISGNTTVGGRVITTSINNPATNSEIDFTTNTLTYFANTHVFTTSVGGIAGTPISIPVSATLQLGAADAAAPVAQTLQVQSVVAGTTNTAGADFSIYGSKSTGTGAGGSLKFYTSPAGSTGSAQNAGALAMTIDSTKLVTFNGAIAANTLTATTQSPGDNTTNVATTAFVKTAATTTNLTTLTTGTAPAAGKLGQVISATTTQASPVTYAASSTATDIVSVTLSAGTWACTANPALQLTSTTVTSSDFSWISLTTATLPAAPNSGGYRASYTSKTGNNYTWEDAVGTFFVNVSGSTTVYLSGLVGYAGTAPVGYGTLNCVRVG